MLACRRFHGLLPATRHGGAVRRRGHTDRVDFRLAEFPAGASAAPRADVVTLHRVVCCNAEYAPLLEAAAGHAARLLAFSYPRPNWIAQVVVAGANGIRRLTGQAFRVYLHPVDRMRAVLARAGLRQVSTGGTWIWAVGVFERAT